MPVASSFRSRQMLPRHTLQRLMSTARPKLHQFVVYAPDKTDDGALQRRLSVRPKHLERATRLHESGFMKIGGAMLTPESIDTPTSDRKMVGSVLIMEAESLAAVRKAIEEDIYYTADVWDPEKIVIAPFVPALM